MNHLLFDGTDSTTVPINRKTAMSIPAIAKGRNIISTSIARMPLVAEKNNRPLATQPSFLVQLQNGVPNFTTLAWIVDGLIFYGRAYLLIEDRASNGAPKSFRFVPEWEAETDNGILKRAFDKPVAANGYVRIDAHHEGFLNYGSEIIRDVKELARTAAEVGASPVPSIILKQKAGTAPLNAEEKAGLLSGWSANRRKRFGSVAYLNSAVDAEVVGAPAENLLIEGRNYAVLEIGRAMGIPAYFLDGSVDGASLTYTNVSGKNRQLIDEALAPYMISIEQTLSMYLPAGTVVEFDTSALLRGDTKERMDMYSVAITAGVYTANEAREMENLEPLDEPAPVVPEALPTPDKTEEPA
jgi:phage portal protein BeeE